MGTNPRAATGIRSSRGRGASPTATVARYLEAAYYIAHEGEPVRPGRLAEWLGVGPPTVSATLQRMRRDGLAITAGERRLVLTPAGESAAAAIVRRHRILECWLTSGLGLDWATADEEASRLAHAISDAAADRLHQVLGGPTTCPHGNEIPGTAARVHQLVRLTELEADRPARVARISELAEHEAPELLRLLDREGIRPGVAVSVRAHARGGPRAVRVDGREVQLGDAAARAIWVESVAAAAAPWGQPAGRPGSAVSTGRAASRRRRASSAAAR